MAGTERCDFDGIEYDGSLNFRIRYDVSYDTCDMYDRIEIL